MNSLQKLAMISWDIIIAMPKSTKIMEFFDIEAFVDPIGVAKIKIQEMSYKQLRKGLKVISSIILKLVFDPCKISFIARVIVTIKNKN